MASSSQSSSVLLNRILTLKESSALILIQDTIAQSSHHLVQEFLHHLTDSINLIYVSYETVNKTTPNFIEALGLPLKKLIESIEALEDPSKKNFVIIDSINYITSEHISQFITSIIRPNVTVLTTYHTSLPDSESVNPSYPSAFKILSFVASSIFEILPTEDEDILSDLNKLKIVKGLNNESFKVNFISRRKSGRSLSYKFHINTRNHQYTPIIETSNEGYTDSESLLKDLTTFNLTTSSKQKLARESVDLPFLEAQKFGEGGAIVYEFEKDDDYDEEDPYEDPF